GRIGLVDDDLRDAVAIAQVEERQLPVLPTAMDPAGERRALAGVLGAELARGVGSIGRRERGCGDGHGPRMVRGSSATGDQLPVPGRRSASAVAVALGVALQLLG